MAGTVDLVQRAYTGAEIRDGVLYFAPTLTDRLDGLSFPMQVHGTPIRVTLGDRELTVVITGGFSRAIRVGIGDDVRELGAGERCTFALADAPRPSARAAIPRGSERWQQGFEARSSTSTACSSTRRTRRRGATTFSELMESGWADIRDQTSWTAGAFTPQVYQQVLSGKPRMEGALAALEHFGVPDPETRVGAYAERKQEMVVELIEAGKFSAYPDALRFLLAVKDAASRSRRRRRRRMPGCSCARSASTSSPRREGLEYDWIEDGLTLLDAFDVDISGRHFERASRTRRSS